MKTNSFKKISMASVAVLIALLASVMVGCQKEEYEPLNDSIINSSELEEYIIAGADFHQSLAIFEKEINKVDFSKLEITYNTDGGKIMRLPASVGSIRIEEKNQIFNEKKQALHKKYPQFAFFTLDISKQYFQQCIQNSINVSGKFLELGINTFRPKLKNDSEGSLTNYSGDEDISYMFWLLYNWVSNPNYVEVHIISYADGDYAIWIDDRNTPLSSHITVYGDGNGNWQHNGRDISFISHTHGAGDNGPCASTKDRTSYSSTPGLERYIYYQGSFYDYNYCN
jgi:hypothetical protein